MTEPVSRSRSGYLLSHSIGLSSPELRAQGIADYNDVLEQDPANTWPHWLSLIDEFRGSLARLFDTDAALLCPQVNVSSAVTKAMQSLPTQAHRALASAEAFPSLGFVLSQTCDRLDLLPAELDSTNPEVWAEHFDADPDLDVVLITHVHSNTGEVLPVASIVEAARVRGIVTVVDVAQSAGVIPIDVAEWNADFVVGSCVKWLCGGPGAGFMWVHPDMVDRCRPVDVGWFSHVDPFEFDIEHFAYASDALRFWGGTPSVLPAAIARRSIDHIVEIGVDVVRARNLELGDRLIGSLPAEMVASPVDAHRRSGTAVVDPGGDLDALVERLAAQGIAVDARPGGLRVSPHVWNTTDDIDALVAAIS